jgi:hypothetical protein
MLCDEYVPFNAAPRSFLGWNATSVGTSSLNRPKALRKVGYAAKVHLRHSTPNLLGRLWRLWGTKTLHTGLMKQNSALLPIHLRCEDVRLCSRRSKSIRIRWAPGGQHLSRRTAGAAVPICLRLPLQSASAPHALLRWRPAAPAHTGRWTSSSSSRTALSAWTPAVHPWAHCLGQLYSGCGLSL